MMDEVRMRLEARIKPPELTDYDREVLRMLSAEGQPLYKIFKSLLDHADDLKDTIASADLWDADQLALARRAQQRYNGSLDVARWFISLYDDPTQRPRTRKTD